MSLEGRKAFVSGGASGIGRGICLRLAEMGVDVAVADVNRAGAEAVAHEVESRGRAALAVETDVSRSASVHQAVEAVHAKLGRVQILVNDAGIADVVPIYEMNEERWDRMIAVHLKGTFNCTRAFVADLIDAGWGRIVNVASVAGVNGGGAGLSHYAAAKGGIIAFTKAIAHDLGPKGITANVIAPGLIDTPMTRQGVVSEQLFTMTAQNAPVRRVGSPADIAAACAYLVSEEAGFITGQVVSPNGGRMM
jgi:NAD(P)-dependent dehydrogenase (short-subunit alcohol dehydrogenase family)